MSRPPLKLLKRFEKAFTRENAPGLFDGILIDSVRSKRQVEGRNESGRAKGAVSAFKPLRCKIFREQIHVGCREIS
jgi:hypothetical protein